MTIQEIASRLAELCKTDDSQAAYNELFAEDAVAIEPEYAPGPSVTKGLDNLRAKSKEFQGAIQEVHSDFVSEPLVAGNYISLAMGMDVTMKDGSRMNMEEICLYKVQDGKIVEERFFY
ncbi:MAG: SnoaL-like domain-containing protein [Bacteroidota bacterium]